MPRFARTLYLWLEWAALFVLAPLLLYFWWQPAVLAALLILVSGSTAWWLGQHRKFGQQAFWRAPNARREPSQLRRLLRRLLPCLLLLAGLVLWHYPEQWLALPRRQPLVWVLLLVLYPVLSVYPQELIYRAFFFRRYRRLFPGKQLRVWVSAVVFALLHIVYQNWLAVGLTFVGGWFFAQTYARTRSLRLVWLEHTLYGLLLFTLGLGDFFDHHHVAAAPAVHPSPAVPVHLQPTERKRPASGETRAAALWPGR
ncbi:CPBP family intramembrane metalloprotease [Hymenobacter sp. 15J16-1T3B]|uniref:CPBP family intramembrane glutamic endopeptidase n=1 Tax=Hymenobacter sp. 15J16-1T3B TaxID=2886941 RepID=UPI001D117B76|nr:CPBP family intramembrane glutamic endopeptidase [Hymenobacter sp. 15J16-1T3B]MCC3159346.1 CPBP family intramembrane metalloprotease [Hymenobacter sp. 15J16-1T3B]